MQCAGKHPMRLDRWSDQTGLVWWVVLLLLVGVMGCGGTALSNMEPSKPIEMPGVDNTVSVNRLKQVPQGAMVQLRGKVIHQAPLVGSTAYELQDDTGTVWVVSRSPLPALGTEVTIKAAVRYQQIDRPDQPVVYVEQQ